VSASSACALFLKIEQGGNAGYVGGAQGLSRQQFYTGHRNEVSGAVATSDSVTGDPAGFATVGNGWLIYVSTTQNNPAEFAGDSHLCVLYPGQSCYWTNDFVASTLYASFEWEEYPLTDAT
jgi:hypothetical protein